MVGPIKPEEVELGSWREKNQMRKIKDNQMSVKAPAFVPNSNSQDHTPASDLSKETSPHSSITSPMNKSVISNPSEP